MDCSPPGSSAHGIFQAWILEWVAISFFLTQGIFLTQGSNPHLLHLLHWQADSLPLLHLAYNLKKKKLFWLTFNDKHGREPNFTKTIRMSSKLWNEETRSRNICILLDWTLCLEDMRAKEKDKIPEWCWKEFKDLGLGVSYFQRMFKSETIT